MATMPAGAVAGRSVGDWSGELPPRQTPLIEPDVGLPSSGSPTMFMSQLSQQVAIESTQRANAVAALVLSIVYCRAAGRPARGKG